jgi:hypothetical protein
MKTAKFNKEIHDLCDPPSREAIIKYVKDEWNLLAEDYEMYKVDLIIKNQYGKSVGYAELEMRDWDECPFQTIHIPQRKKKLFDNDMTTVYFVVNRKRTMAYYINTKDITEHPLKEVSNTRIPQGEYFYDVPKDIFNVIYLKS